MILIFAIGLGALALVAMIARQWNGNTRDLGTMSRQWVVEQSAQHPTE